MLKAHGLRSLDLEPKEVNLPLLFDALARDEELQVKTHHVVVIIIIIIVVSPHFHNIYYVVVFILS